MVMNRLARTRNAIAVDGSHTGRKLNGHSSLWGNVRNLINSQHRENVFDCKYYRRHTNAFSSKKRNRRPTDRATGGEKVEIKNSR